jgi:uncharacterized protein YbdZ (MbtH family)
MQFLEGSARQSLNANQSVSPRFGEICEKWIWFLRFFAVMSAMSESEQDQIVYKVVISHEEQYSIWPADRENPSGWRDVGKHGPKQECFLTQIR